MQLHPILYLSALLMLPSRAVPAVDSELRQPVRIESGLVQGAANDTNDVVAFKGIPYAAPPVGDLRWREPQAPAKWDGIRKTTAFGAACPQPASSFAPPYTAEFAAPPPMSEDCLFLNVWTPAKSAADKLAVLFFIHGGVGTGAGSVPVYDGEELARKGILVVTINFRLGLLAGMGHPQLTAESPHHVCGNYGMLDMIAALRWVRENIGAFGGDPGKVTVFGQSSGAMAMHYLTTSPLAKGLFRGVIGASFSHDYLTKQHAVGNVWQKEQEGLKFAAAKNARSLEDLRKIPVAELIAHDPTVGSFTRNCLGALVNTDGWLFPTAYPDALDRGLACDVPILTGLTADDAGTGPPAQFGKTTAASFAADAPQWFGEKKDAFLAVKDAFSALCPVTTDDEAREIAKRTQVEYRMASLAAWVKRRAKTATTPVYTYLFDHAIPWPAHPEFGAFHSSDLIYEFTNLKMLDRPWTAGDRRVADEISSYWVNFVKTGNPNGNGLPQWQPFDTGHPSTMSLGLPSGPRDIAGKERLAFYQMLLGQ